MGPLAIVLVALLQAQASSVEGIVTKPGGGEPLSGARVTLLPLGTEPGLEKLSVVSQDDGSFSFSNVPPGDYTLRAESVRYGSAAYGQRQARGPGRTLTVNPAQRLAGIRIAMLPTGAIAGRITGMNGQPYVGAKVQAFQYEYRGGRRVLGQWRAVWADDRGEYRLFGLAPGKYLVAATRDQARMVPAAVMMDPNGAAHQVDSGVHASMVFQMESPARNKVLDDGTVLKEAWMPVYYPGTIEARLATPIEVSAGTTMSGVHIAISPAPVRKISGQMIGSPGSIPSATLTPESAEIGFKNPTNSGSSDGSTFEFDGLSPGGYTLIARDPKTRTASAPLQIELADRDIENITLALVPGITVEGKVVVENAGQPPGTNPLNRVLISLQQANREDSMEQFRPQSSGSFVAKDLIPGTYFVQLIDRSDEASEGLSMVNFDPDWSERPSGSLFVKSVRLGQTEVTDGIPITAATQERLEIVLTDALGSIDGTVADVRGALADATVVLVPATARRNLSLYRSTVTDAAGRFRLHRIVPGAYLLFAWDDVETGAWQDPEFLRPLESRGRSVQVQAGRNSMDTIPVISKP
ncbi:MAG TPA: carboxypeptidase-like regulatory domain-containing protein [Terriglobia bacterium]|nr:carboxypeptidase-like regulatory domain-containing protein [Terriglobia bacterium]